MTTKILCPGDRTVSWLGYCHNKWEFLPVKYICDINSRGLPETTLEDTEIYYIDISSVDSEGKYTLSEPMTFGDAPSRARRILSDGDVLISTVRTYLKAIAHIEEASGNIICSTGFAVLSSKEKVFPCFLSYWVRSNYFIEEIVARSLGVIYCSPCRQGVL
jgi:type I restriction enzyme S subunit